jgi:hypothetical protein
MARITINDVRTHLGISDTFDIINAIRNENPQFASYVPLADATNVAAIGAGIMINKTTQNDFITNLVDRIGLVVMKKATLNNPLKKFKKGAMPFGKTIEEIFTDITKSNKYDPADAEQTLYKRTIPNVKTLFHERNRQEYYSQTIQDDSLKSAFTSWGNFDNFLTSIINAIYNSAEVDEYEYMKLLVDNYHSKGLFTVIPVTAPTTETATREFVKKLRATAKKMTLPTGSRAYNALAVRTRSDMSDLHLLIDADLEANLDVDVLAKAFNMDRTNFVGNVTVIDGFNSSGLEAVLIDKEWFMVYDNELSMETVRNAKGKYWNYFYHVWQTFSVSRFSNAVAFVSGTVPALTQVIVDPTIVALKPNDVYEFNAYVRVTDGSSPAVAWSVVAGNSSVLDAGTTINATTGILTVSAAQTGELLVKATVSTGGVDIDGAGADGVSVVGESIVTIIPV